MVNETLLDMVVYVKLSKLFRTVELNAIATGALLKLEQM